MRAGRCHFSAAGRRFPHSWDPGSTIARWQIVIVKHSKEFVFVNRNFHLEISRCVSYLFLSPRHTSLWLLLIEICWCWMIYLPAVWRSHAQDLGYLSIHRSRQNLPQDTISSLTRRHIPQFWKICRARSIPLSLITNNDPDNAWTQCPDSKHPVAWGATAKRNKSLHYWLGACSIRSQRVRSRSNDRWSLRPEAFYRHWVTSELHWNKILKHPHRTLASRLNRLRITSV